MSFRLLSLSQDHNSWIACFLPRMPQSLHSICVLIIIYILHRILVMSQSCSVPACCALFYFLKGHFGKCFSSWLLDMKQILGCYSQSTSSCFLDLSLCVAGQHLVTLPDPQAVGNHVPEPLRLKRNRHFFFSLSVGMSLQAKQHAEKAKEILASSLESPYHDNTDVFRCSIELFYTTGRALLALQKYPFASNPHQQKAPFLKFLWLILKQKVATRE